MMGDLHMHSYYSDGALSPTEVATLCRERGCQIVSLTDHDNIGGIEEMSSACQKLNLVNIAGSELSSYCGCEVHILAYNFDVEDRQFVQLIDKLSSWRLERSYRIIQKLNDHNINISYDDAKQFARKNVSRSHIAAAMVSGGYVKDTKTAFDSWLKEGRVAYVPHEKIAPDEIISVIKCAGGFSSLAHPMRMNMDKTDKVKLIKRLKEFGLDAIETDYRNASKEIISYYTNLASSLNMLTTCGGDFHNLKNNEIIPRRITSEVLNLINMNQK